MYQLVMIWGNSQIAGKVFGTLPEAEKQAERLNDLARENSFLCEYRVSEVQP